MSTVVTVAATVKPTEPPKEAKLVDLEIIENGNQRVVGWRVHNKNTPYGLGYDVYAVYSDNSKRKVDALYYPLVNGKIDFDHPVDGYKVESSNIDVYRVGGNDITLSYNGITKTKRLSTIGKDPTKTGLTAQGSVLYSGNYSSADINKPDGVTVTVEWSWLDSNGRIIEDADKGSAADGITYNGKPFYVDCGATTTINIVYENQTLPVTLSAATGFSRAQALGNFAILNKYRKAAGLPELTWWENGYEYSQLRLIEATEDIAQYGWSAEAGHKRDYLWGLETFSTLDGGVNYKDDIDQLMHSTEHNLIIMGGSGSGGLCSIAVWNNDCMIITIVYSTQVNTGIYIDKDYNMRNPDGSLFRQHIPGWDGTHDPRWIDICNQGGH